MSVCVSGPKPLLNGLLQTDNVYVHGPLVFVFLSALDPPVGTARYIIFSDFLFLPLPTRVNVAGASQAPAEAMADAPRVHSRLT